MKLSGIINGGIADVFLVKRTEYKNAKNYNYENPYQRIISCVFCIVRPSDLQLEFINIEEDHFSAMTETLWYDVKEIWEGDYDSYQTVLDRNWRIYARSIEVDQPLKFYGTVERYLTYRGLTTRNTPDYDNVHDVLNECSRLDLMGEWR